MSTAGLKLQVEGWRGIAHSYALVNQFQLVEFSQVAGLVIFHKDVAFYGKNWVQKDGLLPAAAEAVIRSLPHPPPDYAPDLVLRISYPYNFTPIPSGRLIVFGTAENSVCPKDSVVGAGNGGIGAALAESKAILLTPSEWSRKGFLRSGADPERVKVVPHGVDSGIFKPASMEQKALGRQKLGLKEDDFIFLNIGSLGPNKGIPLLLKAFIHVAAANPRARLILKYNQSLYSAQAFLEGLANLATPAERAILASRVQLVGGLHSMADLALLHQVSDAYVAPYHAEAFNLPALEACACGLTVICTAGGPTDEFLPPGVLLPVPSRTRNISRDGQDMVVLEADEGSLVRLMNSVVHDPALAHHALLAGPVHAAGNFAWSRICEQILRIALG
jgi:glycosyltransferase involved in cell wall biosynthesis